MAKPKEPSQTTLLGAAGEYHVMAELLRRGYIAALAPQGAPNVDIVVTDRNAARACSIQVKSRRDRGSDGGWHLHEKHENLHSDHLFYCFVDFGKTPQDPPSVYVLPSQEVAKAAFKSHRQWLANPGKDGRAHKDSPVRRLLPDYKSLFPPDENPFPSGWLNKYRDAWHLLQLDSISSLGV